MIQKFLIAVLLLTFGQIGFGQTSIDTEKLDSYFEALEENDKFMGSVAVSRNGEIIYTKSVGYADLENEVKANKNSKYRIGSISKTFTTVLILKAVEQKKLKLDQTIKKYFPTIKNAKKITIKHLLSHRSGIHSFTDDEDYLSWCTEPKTEAEMIEIISEGESEFKPGSKAKYSNSNFILLTYILEKTYDKSYAELLQEFILGPLGLTSTYVFGDIDPEKNECKSYNYTSSWQLEPETHYSVPLGAGAITSTPSELIIFADALFGGKLLELESLEIMKTIQDNYGIGLFQIPFYSHMGYGHTGGIDGFSSVFSHFPKDTLSYALTSNGSNYNNNNISIAVLSAVFGKSYDIPEFTTYDVTSEELDQYLGAYTSKEINFTITITKEDGNLIAQGTGQPAFPLQPTAKDEFKFEKASAKFEFKPKENTMYLIQGGARNKFVKEEE